MTTKAMFLALRSFVAKIVTPIARLVAASTDNAR